MDEKLIIDVARLKAEGEEFSGVVDDAVLEIDGELLRPFGGIRYEISAQLFGRELLVRGTLSQDFDAVCARCGGDFDFTLTVDDFTASVETDEKSEFVDLTDLSARLPRRVRHVREEPQRGSLRLFAYRARQPVGGARRPRAGKEG